MHILVHDGSIRNVDNEADAGALLALGAHELTATEIAEAGMAGLEHLVSPLNTSVGPDGRITFSPPAGPTPEEARAVKTAEILSGYDAALAASLTMPAENPTAQDVAVGAALFAVEDAEGLAFVRETHTARRDELLAAVAAAETVEAVRAVEVIYAV